MGKRLDAAIDIVGEYDGWTTSCYSFSADALLAVWRKVQKQTKRLANEKNGYDELDMRVYFLVSKIVNGEYEDACIELAEVIKLLPIETNTMTQTAVKWLIGQICNKADKGKKLGVDFIWLMELAEQAKAMELEKLKQAFLDGVYEGYLQYHDGIKKPVFEDELWDQWKHKYGQ